MENEDFPPQIQTICPKENRLKNVAFELASLLEGISANHVKTWQ